MLKAPEARRLPGKAVKKAACGEAFRKEPSYENDLTHDPIASRAGSRYISRKNKPALRSSRRALRISQKKGISHVRI